MASLAKSVHDVGQSANFLQALIKDLSQNQNNPARASSLSERITGLADDMQGLKFNRKENNAALIRMHTCAVTLWNLAVAMKTGGTVDSTSNARLRHAACNISFVANAADTSETTCKKHLMMATKTGRAWLDCQNAPMADKSLARATECWEELQTLWAAQPHEKATAEQNRQRAESERYMFRAHCYRAEAAVLMSQSESAHRYVNTAKTMLNKLPKENASLSMLCYNFGVDTYYREEYEDSVAWLRESYELGKEKNAVAPKNQATTLRLMANAYLDLDSKQHWQKAVDAVGLANSEHPHPAGLYLKAKVLFMEEDLPSSHAQSALEETLRHPDLNLDLGLCSVNLAIQTNRTQMAFDGLRLLATRFQNSPDLAKIQLQHLELLLKNDQDKAAKDLVEDCIVGHNTGRPLDAEIRKKFHLLLWERAASSYDGHDYKEAVNWYNYSLSLFTTEELQSKNAAKLQRNKCSCFIMMNDFKKAKEVVTAAEKCDSHSAEIYYYKYKIALMQGDDEEAITAISKMSEAASSENCNDKEVDVHGLICLAAQMALERSNRDVAVRALESLIQNSSDNNQVLTALRCLIRLRITLSETETREQSTTILDYLNNAREKLHEMTGQKIGNIQTEASWFMKIAWNLALQNKDCSQHLHDFFILCFKFAGFCILDSARLIRQKNCLLMAAAASLQISREGSNGEEKEKALKQALDHVHSCRDLCKNMDIPNKTLTKATDDSMVMLILYEFEAKVKLGETTGLDVCLDNAAALPYTEPQTFETLAALAVEPPCYYKEISTKALRLAIQRHLAMDKVDYTKLSKTFHSLVQLSLSVGSSSDALSKEEAYTIYQEVAEIIDKDAQETYPEMAVLWLMTKAWNCGVYLFSAGKLKAAEKWCAMAMRLLKQLSSLKCNYEDKMTGIYSEILARIETSIMRSPHSEE